MWSFSVCLMVCGFFSALAADLPAPAVQDAIKDKFVPAAYDRQKIDGLLGARMRVNLEGRLLHVDEPRLLAGFQHRPGNHPWIGEHIGKFLDAAANTWVYTGDQRLKTLMDRMARELIATQLPDGYLGTYTDDQRWTSWDVWSHKYDLIGLLRYYQVTGYSPALDASRKIGDLLVRTFGTGPGQRDIIAAGTHMGMAATSVLEPVCMLYRYTGDRRYLDFAHYLVRAYDQPNGPKVIASLLKTGSVYGTADDKAYEMLSNLVGLVDLYRLTGDNAFLKPALIAWKDVTSKRLYITGATSSKEHFLADFDLPGDNQAQVGEGCVTVTWIQLNWQLLRLTGEQQYADEIERTVYNQLLGAQAGNGDISYFTPVNGTKQPTPGINCCVSSEPRGISMIPQLAWGAREGSPAVLLYVPGEVKLQARAGSKKLDVTLKSVTEFPMSGHVSISVTPSSAARFPIYLRVPAWCTKYTASGMQGTPGQYLTLERLWKPGDKIDIAMDIPVRAVDGGKSYPGSVAIERGPQVLALEASLNPAAPDLAKAAPPSIANVVLADAADRLPQGWFGKQAYAIDGAGKQMVLVPFMDARSYRVWLTAPPRK
jgi:DUF1680 family protein